MPRIARSEAVVPKQMSEAERSALTDALFEVHGAIFGGVDRARTVSTVVSPASDFTTILLHKNDEGKIVGFFAIHFYDRQLRGRPATIVRSIVGMLRAYRGQNVNIGWALRTLLTRRLASPSRPFYGFGLMAHPSSYLQVSRYVDVFWPAPNEPIPPDVLDFMLELADEFKLVRTDPRQPLVRGGAVPTQETEAERNYWRQRAQLDPLLRNSRRPASARSRDRPPSLGRRADDRLTPMVPTPDLHRAILTGDGRLRDGYGSCTG
jgi:hypothetical protein